MKLYRAIFDRLSVNIVSIISPFFHHHPHQILPKLVGQLAVIVRIHEQKVGLLAHLDGPPPLAHADGVGGIDRAGIYYLGRQQLLIAAGDGHHQGHRRARR